MFCCIYTRNELIFKNQKGNTNNKPRRWVFLYWIYIKSLIKALKNLVRREKEEMKKEQILWYFNRLKIKTVKTKTKEHKLGLFDQG